VFDLPPRLHRKADPLLIGRDEQQFAAIARALAADVRRTEERTAALQREAVGGGQRALERDLEVQSLTARLRILRRFGLDACIGRMVDAAGTVTYIGRFGLADAAEERLLTDWRAPASAPFFAATAARPLGLTSRRRYRWREGRIVDYWDEMFADDGVDHSGAFDDQSAFIASLGASRSPRMRDVLGTIQADQDAIIRADSRRALVVDGGPGTGKTVVALHRAAYLLYDDARIRAGHGGLLFVGPHRQQQSQQHGRGRGGDREPGRSGIHPERRRDRGQQRLREVDDREVREAAGGQQADDSAVGGRAGGQARDRAGGGAVEHAGGHALHRDPPVSCPEMI